MENHSSDSSDSANENKDTTIVNGLFGIDDKENSVENNAVCSDYSDNSDCFMSVENELATDKHKLSEKSEHKNTKLMVVDNCTMMVVDNCTTITDDESVEKKDDLVEMAESKSFGSNLLCSKFSSLDNSEIPPSFATVSENYKKLRNDIASKDSLTPPTNSDQVSEMDSKFTVVLPKGQLPSTLSMISMNYQDSSSSSDESDTTSDDNSDSVQILNDDDDDADSIISISSNITKDNDVKTRGELSINDLPPIEDLKISVDEEKCEPVGCIKSIVDTLVIIEAFLNQPALDIDSILFVDRGQRALGKIYDVFGPVTKPFYAIRFNDSNHIKRFDIKIKEPVYCAPQTEYTSYVMVSQLMKIKGSDASWKHNNEPPPQFLDYSDDEAEKLAKKERKNKNRSNIEDPEYEVANSPAQNVRNKPAYRQKPNNHPVHKTPTPQSFNQPSNETQESYNHRPFNYNSNQAANGPRPFPTYAQQLSSMEFSHSYRQPYNAWCYDQMNAPRHNNPNPYQQQQQQQQQHHYMPPGYNNYQPPNVPNVYNYPPPQLPPTGPNNPNRYDYQIPQQPPNDPNYSIRYNYPNNSFR